MWQGGAMCDWGDAWPGGHEWPGACMAGGHAWLGGYVAGGHVWQGGMHGRGHACMAGGMHAWQGSMCGRGCACVVGACVAVGDMRDTHAAPPPRQILRLWHTVNNIVEILLPILNLCVVLTVFTAISCGTEWTQTHVSIW